MAVTIHRKRRNSDKVEAVNIRMSSKLKFALDLAARRHEKSQSAYVVEVLLRALKSDSELNGEWGESGQQKFLPDLVWDELEVKRLVKLAQLAPEFLNRHESLVWTAIQEDEAYFKQGEVDFKAVRDDWKAIEAAANDLAEGI